MDYWNWIVDMSIWHIATDPFDDDEEDEEEYYE
jgi:hypothetical protein